MELKSFNIDVAETEFIDRLRIYSSHGDIYEALIQINDDMVEHSTGLEYVNVMPGSSDYGIILVNKEELLQLHAGADIIDPNWFNDDGWKSHVSQEVREMWNTFSDEQKIALQACYEDS